MPNWKDGSPLTEDQTPRPVLWYALRDLPDQLPDTSDSELATRFDMGGRSQRLQTWGKGDAKDNYSVHWLSTRSGTPFHTDPKYPRYTHHLTLRNDGWRISGLEDTPDSPMLVQGMMLCLDTWSPHRVLRDPRCVNREGLYKVALAVDQDEMLEPSEAWALLSTRLTDASCADVEGIQS